jgi:uncharacterized repeat protein (TIGR02543 family)
VGATVALNALHSLSVTANVTGGELSYRWYSNTSLSNNDGSVISGVTSASYNPPTGTAGAYYYFAEITNTITDNGDGGNKTASSRSNAVEIRIPSPSGMVIDLNMNEWNLTEQTAQATANADKIFSVTGTYTAYRWYLDGTSVGTSSSYTFNKPAGVYQLVVIATNSAGESRSGRCRITVAPSLTANVWTDDSITDANGEDWYSFPVTSGTTYSVWWNDNKEGNGTKSGDVAVSARYENATTFIFGGTDTTVDSGYTTALSFSASQTGRVFIRVIPYNRGSSYTGTYGIVYSSSTSTRPATYTVTFNVNSGSGTAPVARTVAAGSGITIPDGNGLSRSGYVFGGWNTNSSGTGTNYNAGSSYTPTADITLYARWHINYTVTFNVNSGSGTAPTAQTVINGSSIILPGGSGLSRSGYTFGGWNTNTSGTGTNYNAGSSYTPTASITLYARWYTNYTVTFNAFSGSGTTPATYTGAHTLSLPDGRGLSRSGYTFGGWNTNSSGTGTNYNAGTSYTPTASITLYARWTTGTPPVTGNTIFSEDFEGTTHSFTIVNGSQTNQWWVGTATSAGGTKSAYISNTNGSSNNYSITAASTVHLYRNITFPTSSQPFTLTFDRKVQGEGTSTLYDYLRVFLVETSTSITAGSQPSGTTLGTYNLGGSGWNSTNISIPASNSGTTKRLVFTWVNDGSDGTQPPAAVDNIVLRSN